MTKIIHYMDPQSRAMRSQMILDFYKIPHEKVQLTLRSGDHRKPEYKEVHPYQRVPALRYGDQTILESGAIVLFLADVFADKMNTPAVGTPERAMLYEWVLFSQSTLEPEATRSFDPAQKDSAKAKIQELLEAMATRFRGPYVLGEKQSVLDVILYTELLWYQIIGLFPDGLEPYAGFMQRQAAQMPVYPG
jgi:glutathione S-transferase